MPRRWSLPTRLPRSSPENTIDNEDTNNTNGGDGDIEIGESRDRRRATTIPTTTTNRATATPSAPEPIMDARQRAIQEEINLALIYAQLNEAFGMDLGYRSAVLVEGEVLTVASTCTESSCGSQEGEEERAARLERNRSSYNSETTLGRRMYAIDPRTGLQLPMASPVGADIHEALQDDCSCTDCLNLVCGILCVLGLFAAIIFLLYILL